MDEDGTEVAVEASDGGGEGAGFGADETDGEATESGDVLGAVSGADAATVFVPRAVEDVVGAFDDPVAAVESEETLG